MKLYELINVLALGQFITIIDRKTGEILANYHIELHTQTDEFDQKFIDYVFVDNNTITVAIANE